MAKKVLTLTDQQSDDEFTIKAEISGGRLSVWIEDKDGNRIDIAGGPIPASD